MQADIPIALLLAGILSSSCLTTQPLDPAISYRERLWAEIGPLSLPFEELLWRDKPIGPETLRYLHTYGFEPVSGIPTQWKVSLGLLFDQDSQAREPYLVQPSSCTQPSHPSLPPLGVLVGLPTLHLDGERPRNHVRGTVFLVHGYLDHSGSWSPVIKKILSERFVVVALDLPGHGVSGGIRGDIEDFSQYGEAVRRVRDWAEQGGFPRPWIGLGHSTGAAAIWMELVRQRSSAKTLEIPPSIRSAGKYEEMQSTSAFDCVVFLAPLVRSAHWRLSMTLVSLTSWAVPYLKSRTMEDPLFPIPYFPVRWAKRLMEWEKKAREYPILPQKGWIFQGTKDEVIDHIYSIPFLRSKLPEFQVRYIEGAGHVPYLPSPAEEGFIQEVMRVLSRYP